VAVSVEDGRTVLRVDGVIQSLLVDERHVPDVWDAMIPSTLHPQSALLLGLGGGTIAALLMRRFGPLPMVGVERDARIIQLARETFGLGRLPSAQIVHADARAFVTQCQARFDLVCVDLFTGGKLEHGVLSVPFLRHIGRLATPAGAITINLWSSVYLVDQLRRIGRVLRVRDVIEVGGNVIVHCGPPATDGPLVRGDAE
jgi:spermidine synthase